MYITIKYNYKFGKKLTLEDTKTTFYLKEYQVLSCSETCWFTDLL